MGASKMSSVLNSEVIMEAEINNKPVKKKKKSFVKRIFHRFRKRKSVVNGHVTDVPVNKPLVEMKLMNKVVIVTGGATGIGEATARLFSSNGAQVVIADTEDELGSKVCEEVKGVYIHCDMKEEIQVQSLVNSTIERFGHLDIMLNNLRGGKEEEEVTMNDVSEIDIEKWESLVGDELRGIVLGMKYAAKAMMTSSDSSSSILNLVSSLCGDGCCYFCVALKHAVMGLTANGAAQLCDEFGIRVNCILAASASSSSAAAAAAAAEKSVISAADVAKNALFMVSEDGRLLNGQKLILNQVMKKKKKKKMMNTATEDEEDDTT